ncbi:GDYXXLXY domain-containing protein [Hymenobacter guriensis]|uniref:GDYXXLXY domain-containing protein n=1 Tax=Hymenobacter guriensis TaxID=2793065 RepID=A0ABS0L7T9_9BACT|nr:GDYXXLXY domain-containing protein [Hymenobacter guriensis]MBG8556218.1 GDYXXLXY domain-containing protein [Hymenobacter guriensis]
MSFVSDSVPASPGTPPLAPFLPDLPEPTRRRWLRWLVLAQVLFVLGVAASGYATGAWGRTIWLRTTPVDPRDLLYGDYVTLAYTISQVPGHLWRGAQPARRNQAAYVLLQPGSDGTCSAVGIYPEKPAPTPTQAVLRGSVQQVWRRSLTLRYGLERYYVPEGSGKKLERHPRLQVQVRIAPWGQARITQVVPDSAAHE